MNLSTLKASDLKNKPRNTWVKGGFTVYHLANGYWLTCHRYSRNFNTIKEIKSEIKSLLK